MQTIKKLIARQILDAVNAEHPDAGLTEEEIASALEYPPDPGMGDLAFPCFRLSRALRRSPVQIAAALAVVLVAVVVLLAEPLVSVFNSEGSAQLAAYAVPGIRLYFLGFLLACFNIVRAGYFGAVGMGRESAVIALSRGVVSIVLFAVLLAALWGVTGVWLAFPVSEGFTLLISARMGRKS